MKGWKEADEIKKGGRLENGKRQMKGWKETNER